MRPRLLVAVSRHLVLLGTTAFMLMPFVWMFSLSIKPPQEIFDAHIYLWPEHFYGRENYWQALTATPLLRYMLNGLIVTGSILAAQLLVAIPCAYALARLEFPGRDLMFSAVLVGLLIPHQVLALPLFVVFAKLGLLDTYAALILPSTISPFAIFLFRQYFKSLPNELVQAARLDNLSELSIIWRIMFPLAAPATVAFSLLSIVAHWNDLFWPMIVIRSGELATPPLGLTFFQNSDTGNAYGPLMAGTIIIAAPLVIAFLFAQRRFIEGMTAGAIK